MSDTTASAAATDGTAPTGDQNTAPAGGTDNTAPAGGEVDYKAEAEKWKALSRKNEATAKANADAAKKLADIEAAQLSETEKLTKRVEAAEARAAELELKALKAEVAAEKNLPANLLNGTTREELETHADELIRFRGPAGTNDFGAGKTGTKDISDGKSGQLTRDDLKKMSPAEIVEAKKAGRLDAVLGKS
ncbi:hypothetical protein [Amycolatopsis sp. NPDC003731]